MAENLDVTCPCCAATLVVDPGSGEVLAHEAPKRDLARSFDEAMSSVRDGSKRREDAFSKAFQRTKSLDDVLSKKFEEAKKKAADDSSKPHNPLDYD